MEYCSDMGAIMATPRTAAENECANDVAAAVLINYFFWIGYRGGRTAKSLVGADGAAMSFTNWNTAWGEPYLAAADNCVYLYSGIGRWGDFECHNTFRVLCQAPQN